MPSDIDHDTFVKNLPEMETEDEAATRIYVHLHHPCYGIDVVRDVDADEASNLRGQGYVSLADLQKMRAVLRKYVTFHSGHLLPRGLAMLQEDAREILNQTTADHAE